jgi:polyvinyl alcohol dehydrogenase (cytochrome)
VIRRRSLTFAVLPLLLLAACSGGSGSGAAAPPTASAPAAPSPATPSSISAAPAPVSPSTASTTDWTTYHRDAARTGNAPAGPKPGPLAVAWKAKLDGAVYGQPLSVGDLVLAATENDTVYGLDRANGAVRWQQHLGQPVRLSSLPCGNIDPLGITSTMVYDPATGQVFAVAELAGPRHDLVGLDATTGAVRIRRAVDPPQDDPKVLQQRAALALSANRVYLAYGGLYGDCGAYHGWVLAAPTNGGGPPLSYQVPTSRDGGIWAPGGPVVDPAGNLFVAVGNGESTTTYDDTDSVLKLSADLQRLDVFAPNTWKEDNATDADLGSAGPTLLPDGLVFIAGKSGTGYVLRADHLGGVGGQLTSAPVCRSFGGTAVVERTVYVPCRDGIRSITIGADGAIGPGWRAESSIDGSPVVGGEAVWAIDTRGGVLHALDRATGRSTASLPLGDVPHFASPTLSGDRLFVGTMDGVIAVTGPAAG